MSLNKSIESGQEKRKPYKGAKAIDNTCKNHGSCPWCKNNRLHKFKNNENINELDDISNEAEE